MEHPAETIDYRGYTIQIHYDHDPQNPRKEWDNIGKMVCWHSRYTLGDEQPNCTPQEYLIGLLPDNTRIWLEEKWEREAERRWEWLAAKDIGWGSRAHLDAMAELERIQDDELDRLVDREIPLRLPLYLYDHSGITISTGSFSCPWDSGQVGFIYATREEILANWGKKRLTKKVLERARQCLEGGVETYDNYLTGSVYGYVVLGPDGEQVDSCWGYYGYDHEASGLLESAKGEVDGDIRHRRRQRLDKLRELLKAHVPLIQRQQLMEGYV
jgi:hypothetical protein